MPHRFHYTLLATLLTSAPTNPYLRSKTRLFGQKTREMLLKTRISETRFGTIRSSASPPSSDHALDLQAADQECRQPHRNRHCRQQHSPQWWRCGEWLLKAVLRYISVLAYFNIFIGQVTHALLYVCLIFELVCFFEVLHFWCCGLDTPVGSSDFCFCVLVNWRLITRFFLLWTTVVFCLWISSAYRYSGSLRVLQPLRIGRSWPQYCECWCQCGCLRWRWTACWMSYTFAAPMGLCSLYCCCYYCGCCFEVLLTVIAEVNVIVCCAGYVCHYLPCFVVCRDICTRIITKAKWCDICLQLRQHGACDILALLSLVSR